MLWPPLSQPDWFITECFVSTSRRCSGCNHTYLHCQNLLSTSGLFHHHHAIWGELDSMFFFRPVCFKSLLICLHDLLTVHDQYMCALANPCAVCEESYGIAEAWSRDRKIAVRQYYESECTFLLKPYKKPLKKPPAGTAVLCRQFKLWQAANKRPGSWQGAPPEKWLKYISFRAMPEISVNAMKVFLSIVMSCHQPCIWRKLPCCARASPARQRGCNSPLQWILPIFSQAQSISDWNWRAVLANQPNFPSRSILSPPLHVRCGGHTVLMFFAVEELQKLWPTATSLWLWFCALLWFCLISPSSRALAADTKMASGTVAGTARRHSSPTFFHGAQL